MNSQQLYTQATRSDHNYTLRHAAPRSFSTISAFCHFFDVVSHLVDLFKVRPFTMLNYRATTYSTT